MARRGHEQHRHITKFARSHAFASTATPDLGPMKQRRAHRGNTPGRQAIRRTARHRDDAEAGGEPIDYIGDTTGNPVISLDPTDSGQQGQGSELARRRQRWIAHTLQRPPMVSGSKEGLGCAR